MKNSKQVSFIKFQSIFHILCGCFNNFFIQKALSYSVFTKINILFKKYYFPQHQKFNKGKLRDEVPWVDLVQIRLLSIMRMDNWAKEWFSCIQEEPSVSMIRKAPDVHCLSEPSRSTVNSWGPNSPSKVCRLLIPTQLFYVDNDCNYNSIIELQNGSPLTKRQARSRNIWLVSN